MKTKIMLGLLLVVLGMAFGVAKGFSGDPIPPCKPGVNCPVWKITADLVSGRGKEKALRSMKSYLSILDLAMWIALIAGKVMLCLCILKKHFFRPTAIFSALIFASGVGVLLFCSRLLGQLFSLLLRFLHK